jgi:hypothetical protein
MTCNRERDDPLTRALEKALDGDLPAHVRRLFERLLARGEVAGSGSGGLVLEARGRRPEAGEGHPPDP